MTPFHFTIQKKFFSNIGYNENIFEKISKKPVKCILSECPKVELKNSQYVISSFSMNSNIIVNEIKFLIKTYAIFEQYYFVKRSYELLEEYINETKTNYDSVIRLRFDQLVWSSDDFYTHLEYNEKQGIMYSEKNIELLKIIDKRLCVDCPEQNEIYVLGCGVHYNYVYVNDQFWIHGKDMIVHMKNFYDSLPDIINSCIDSFPSFGANIEHFFALYLKDKKIMKSCISGVFIRSKSNYVV